MYYLFMMIQRNCFLRPAQLKWYSGEDFAPHDFKAEILTRSSPASRSDFAPGK